MLLGVWAQPLAAVLEFRGVAFALPPVFGCFTLCHLRKQGNAQRVAGETVR